jgi:hypothetical protein
MVETVDASTVVSGGDANPIVNSSVNETEHYCPSVRIVHVAKTENGACGFHLTRSKWDPYPWVSLSGRVIDKLVLSLISWCSVFPKMRCSYVFLISECLTLNCLLLFLIEVKIN